MTRRYVKTSGMKRKDRKKTGGIPPEPDKKLRDTRTDLALEERELWHSEAGRTTEIPGVQAREEQRRGVKSTLVRILNEEGSRELHKPVGTYLTLELDALLRKEPQAFARVSRTLAGEISALMRLRENAAVLVVGLGNEHITPDALGPLTLRRLLVTRHLTAADLPLAGLRRVSALQPGVLGSTGMESFEIVQAVIEKTEPDALIVVDALAARSAVRLCTTIQLTDAGILPGSGVGNRRLAFTRERLGLPVYAIGAPTVTDAAAIRSNEAHSGADLILTPRSIDVQIRQMAGVIGAALNISLHPQTHPERLAQLVEFGR